MTLLTFIFLGVVWASDGSVDTVTAEPYVSSAQCEARARGFSVEQKAAIAVESPTLRGSFTTGCERRMNTSEAKAI